MFLESDGLVSTLLVCNDHEEVGSLSAAGAQGPLLKSVLRRLVACEAEYAALADRSMMISADNAHGIHPNYAAMHDDNHGPILNRGPVIKTNANQRYATNSETAGLYKLLAGLEQGQKLILMDYFQKLTGQLLLNGLKLVILLILI